MPHLSSRDVLLHLIADPDINLIKYAVGSISGGLGCLLVQFLFGVNWLLPVLGIWSISYAGIWLLCMWLAHRNTYKRGE